MKKNINIIPIVPLCVLCFLPLMLLSQQKDNQSKSLINRYNKIRQTKNLNKITQDTILDNVCERLIDDSNYRNIDNTLNEDSIRQLLHRSGIIDYQYEVKEAFDKDTTMAFNAFLMSDNSTNINMGYNRNGNKHMLFKTKSYMKFDHWLISAHSVIIDRLNSTATKVDVKTDSVTGYFKTLNVGRYFYQLYNRIPLSSEKLGNVKKFEVQTLDSNYKSGNTDIFKYDLIIKLAVPDAYLIISNDNNERIVIIK
ncbi:MAG: hypothetical protein WCJ03_09655 [Bacteroidales bacterium]